LRPHQFYRVFAPIFGQLDKVLLSYGASVKAGEILMVLRSPDLEFDFLQNRRLIEAPQGEFSRQSVHQLTLERRAEQRGLAA